MANSDVEKGKRKRSRRAVFYENLNKPSHPPTRLPDDDDNDDATPAHAEGRGANQGHRMVPGICEQYHDQAEKAGMAGSVGRIAWSTEGNQPASPSGPRSAAVMAASATNATGRGYGVSVSDFNAARTAESRASGQSRSAASGDHNVSAGRNNHVSVGHLDLQQQGTQILPFMQRTAVGPTFVGQSAFDGQWSDTDTPPGADRGRVRVEQLVTGAGSFRGLNPVSRNPGDGSRPYGMSRTSATPDTPGHSLAQPEYRPVASMGKSSLQVMKEALFG